MPPNIVWITLDSVRADHVTPGGSIRNTTPRLQDIVNARNGYYHDQCVSHGRWSLPSITSILTGTYPSYHQTGLKNKVLVSEVPTVAELFSDAGYETACLSRNSHLSSETNLDRGFDRFQYIQASTLLQNVGIRTTAKFLTNIRRHSAGFELNQYAHSTPFLVNDVAKRWVRQLADTSNPFFFHLHYNEPHTPYYPPLPYLNKYADSFDMAPRKAARRALDICRNKEVHIANGFRDLTDEDWRILKAMYDAEIRYTDKMVGDLIEFIKNRSGRRTIFVVTADHGDLFGEYGIFGHTLVLHDGLIHVPLITDGFGVERDFVQHADVIRTLGEIAGIETKSFHGIDLREESREVAISQTGPADLDRYTQYEPEFDGEHYVRSHRADVLRTTEFKYRIGGENEWLFKLPDEETNVLEEHPEIVADLRSKRTEMIERYGTVSEESDAEYSDAMKKQLRALGYRD